MFACPHTAVYSATQTVLVKMLQSSFAFRTCLLLCCSACLAALKLRSQISNWQNDSFSSSSIVHLIPQSGLDVNVKTIFPCCSLKAGIGTSEWARRGCQILAPVVSLHSTSSGSIPAFQSQTSGDAYKLNQDSPHKVCCCIRVPQGDPLKICLESWSNRSTCFANHRLCVSYVKAGTAAGKSSEGAALLSNGFQRGGRRGWASDHGASYRRSLMKE